MNISTSLYNVKPIAAIKTDIPRRMREHREACLQAAKALFCPGNDPLAYPESYLLPWDKEYRRLTGDTIPAEPEAPAKSAPKPAGPSDDARLIAQGYEPVPVLGKIPPAKGWSQGIVTVERIGRERAECLQAESTGLRTGRLVGVDIDITDEGHVTQLIKLATEVLGETAFLRYGKRGAMLCYRNETPIRKVTVKTKEEAKVEILGQGQQFVAFGIHPDTGRPYEWRGKDVDLGDMVSPLTFPLSSLPEVTPEQLRTFANRTADLFTKLGYQPKVNLNAENCEPLKRNPNVKLDTAHEAYLATAYLRGLVKSGDVARQDQGGDNRTLEVFNDLLDHVSGNLALKVVAKEWNPYCEPPWDENELEAKCENAKRYRQNEIGCCATEPPSVTFAPYLVAQNDNENTEGEDKQSFAKYLAAFGKGKVSYPPSLSGRELEEGDYPPESYLVEGVVLENEPNSLYGDGGIGKTLLAENLAIALTAGKETFLGFKTQGKPLPVFLLLGEDDNGPTKKRLREICDYQNVKLSDLAMQVWCLPHKDIKLARVSETGEITPSPFLAMLEAELDKGKYAGGLLVLDSLIDVAEYPEANRSTVNAFFKIVVGFFCQRYKLTVLVLAHPSKKSMEDGSGYSGSTAHKNAVRGLAILERAQNGSDNARVLKIAKANYAAEGSTNLVLMGSVFMTTDDVPVVKQENDEFNDVLNVVFGLLDENIKVVRDARGEGQSPENIATEVKRKTGRKLKPKQVKDILAEAERRGRLKYVAASSHTKASYMRPERPKIIA